MKRIEDKIEKILVVATQNQANLKSLHDAIKIHVVKNDSDFKDIKKTVDKKDKVSTKKE